MPSNAGMTDDNREIKIAEPGHRETPGKPGRLPCREQIAHAAGVPLPASPVTHHRTILICNFRRRSSIKTAAANPGPSFSHWKRQLVKLFNNIISSFRLFYPTIVGTDGRPLYKKTPRAPRRASSLHRQGRSQTGNDRRGRLVPPEIPQNPTFR
jgi:hypothetical protein